MRYPHEGPAALILMAGMTLILLLGSPSLLPVAAGCAVGGLMLAPILHHFAVSSVEGVRLN